MGKKKAKPNYRRSVLRLPDLDHSKLAVLNSLTSPRSRRVYQYAIEQFIAWYCSEPRLAFSRIVVVRYRMHLESRTLAANTINQHLVRSSRCRAPEPRSCGRDWACQRGQAVGTALRQLADARAKFGRTKSRPWRWPTRKTRLCHVGHAAGMRATAIRTRRPGN